MPRLFNIGLQLLYGEGACHTGYIVASVNELGHAGLAALQEHIVITVLGDFLGLSLHDPEGHQVNGMLDGITDRQFADTDTTVLADIMEKDGLCPDAGYSLCLQFQRRRFWCAPDYTLSFG